MFPAFQMQEVMRKKIFGAGYWEKQTYKLRQEGKNKLAEDETMIGILTDIMGKAKLKADKSEKSRRVVPDDEDWARQEGVGGSKQTAVQDLRKKQAGGGSGGQKGQGKSASSAAAGGSGNRRAPFGGAAGGGSSGNRRASSGGGGGGGSGNRRASSSGGGGGKRKGSGGGGGSGSKRPVKARRDKGKDERKSRR